MEAFVQAVGLCVRLALAPLLHSLAMRRVKETQRMTEGKWAKSLFSLAATEFAVAIFILAVSVAITPILIHHSDVEGFARVPTILIGIFSGGLGLVGGFLGLVGLRTKSVCMVVIHFVFAIVSALLDCASIAVSIYLGIVFSIATTPDHGKNFAWVRAVLALACLLLLSSLIHATCCIATVSFSIDDWCISKDVPPSGATTSNMSIADSLEELYGKKTAPTSKREEVVREFVPLRTEAYIEKEMEKKWVVVEDWWLGKPKDGESEPRMVVYSKKKEPSSNSSTLKPSSTMDAGGSMKMAKSSRGGGSMAADMDSGPMWI